MAFLIPIKNNPPDKNGLLTYRITKKDNIVYKIIFIKNVGSKISKKTVYSSPLDDKTIDKTIIYPNTKEVLNQKVIGHVLSKTIPQGSEYAVLTNMFISIVDKEQAIEYFKDFPYDNNIRIYQCEVPEGVKYLYGKYTYWTSKAIHNELDVLAVEELILTKDITNEI